MSIAESTVIAGAITSAAASIAVAIRMWGIPKVQGEIHTLVNSKMQEALDEITTLKKVIANAAEKRTTA